MSREQAKNNKIRKTNKANEIKKDKEVTLTPKIDPKIFTGAIEAFYNSSKELEKAFTTVQSTSDIPSVEVIGMYEAYLDDLEKSISDTNNVALDTYNSEQISKEQLSLIMTQQTEIKRICDKIRTHIKDNWK